ncbi:hypothetical protein K431DRAFT_287508 [Polychaeton citri CBS 116435]|uniref:F-box domain-containing protein n=1 Tax=Polychaeton citri CBS 116435 TaxID=1314669 RepID=A0A9P4Q120_9PEZI|nr:hypothetical protein K431DRAFT_287508 [Polychaeton citri CBS 116435]
MTDTRSEPVHLFALPNEILLSIFNIYSTRELSYLTSTCKRFHSLILRLIQHRLHVAAGLDGHVLYLECYPPAASLTASHLFCKTIGTEGLNEIINDIHNDENYVGQLARLGAMYSRFRPQQKEPDPSRGARNFAGDIPGSRTWKPPNSVQPISRVDLNDNVTATVTVDANDLFCQLTTSAFLGKRESTRGLLAFIQGISDGTIRVWRNWLAEQCESRTFSGGGKVAVEEARHGSSSGRKRRADSIAGVTDPKKDASILWINTRDDNVGIKFRVLERKVRDSNTPILFESDIEMAASYLVEYEEILIRTTHLLLKLEEAQTEINNHSNRAMIFGSIIRNSS